MLPALGALFAGTVLVLAARSLCVCSIWQASHDRDDRSPLRRRRSRSVCSAVGARRGRGRRRAAEQADAASHRAAELGDTGAQNVLGGILLEHTGNSSDAAFWSGSVSVPAMRMPLIVRKLTTAPGEHPKLQRSSPAPMLGLLASPG